MASKSIEVTVGPGGEIRIDAVAFAGPSCERATAFLEEALGKAVRKERKPDYYRRVVTARKQRLGR